MSYTAPAYNEVDFKLKEYQPTAFDEVNFYLLDSFAFSSAISGMELKLLVRPDIIIALSSATTSGQLEIEPLLTSFSVAGNTITSASLATDLWQGYFKGQVKKREEAAEGAKVYLLNLQQMRIEKITCADDEGEFFFQVDRKVHYHLFCEYRTDEGPFYARSLPQRIPEDLSKL